MADYFQRILSRSNSFDQNQSAAVPPILPGSPMVTPAIQEELKESDSLPHAEEGSGNFERANVLSPEQKPQMDSVHPLHTEKPVAIRTPAPNLSYAKTEKTNTTNLLPQSFSQPVVREQRDSIIEKTEVRHDHTTIIEKSLPGRSTDQTTRQDDKSKSLLPNFLDRDKHLNKLNASNKKPDKEILFPNKSQTALHEKRTAHEVVQPAKEGLVIPVVKTKKESKLTIGRITVEVINPSQPHPVRAVDIPKQQDQASSAPSPEFNHINKLSFGLGQL